MSTQPVAPERQSVYLEDRSLAFRRSGNPDGPKAVFLHGLGGSSLNWTDLTAMLGTELDCWAIDLHGFGFSPPSRDGDYSPAAHAQAVAEFIEHHGIGPVHLFGNSLGGAVALQLAARRPDLIQSLTLISPALPTLSMQRTNAHLPVMAIPGLGERLMKKYLEINPEMRAQATIDVCFADPSRISEVRKNEAIEEVIRRDSLPYLAEAFFGSLRGLMATFVDVSKNRPWELAKSVSCPVLLVYGRKDKLVDSKAAHKATKKFPDAHVVVLADSGHVAQMEHPEFVVDAWNRFIRATSPQ